MTPRDLPPSHGLVIGLNPPFGHAGELASLFVNHALTFYPRLLILIVPARTPAVRDLCTDSDRWVAQANAHLRSICVGGRPPTAADHAAVLRSGRPPRYVLSVLDRSITAGAAFYRPGARLIDSNSRDALGGRYSGGGSSSHGVVASGSLLGKRGREDSTVRSVDIIAPGEAPSLFIFTRIDCIKTIPSL